MNYFLAREIFIRAVARHLAEACTSSGLSERDVAQLAMRAEDAWEEALNDARKEADQEVSQLIKGNAP